MSILPPPGRDLAPERWASEQHRPPADPFSPGPGDPFPDHWLPAHQVAGMAAACILVLGLLGALP
jgi:hypothetical protein